MPIVSNINGRPSTCNIPYSISKYSLGATEFHQKSDKIFVVNRIFQKSGSLCPFSVADGLESMTDSSTRNLVGTTVFCWTNTKIIGLFGDREPIWGNFRNENPYFPSFSHVPRKVERQHRIVSGYSREKRVQRVRKPNGNSSHNMFLSRGKNIITSICCHPSLPPTTAKERTNAFSF